MRYDAAARWWHELLDVWGKVSVVAETQVVGRLVWATAQRFFKLLLVGLKVRGMRRAGEATDRLGDGVALLQRVHGAATE